MRLDWLRSSSGFCSILESSCTNNHYSSCWVTSLRWQTLMRNCDGDLQLQAKELSVIAVKRVQTFNRRTMDVLAARLYFYFSYSFELANSLSEIRRYELPCIFLDNCVSLSLKWCAARELCYLSKSCGKLTNSRPALVKWDMCWGYDIANVLRVQCCK